MAWPPTTVAWPFSDLFQNFLIAWNVEKSLFHSRPTVAWPPTTVAWPFSGFFQKIPNFLKRPKTLFDSRTTVAWPPTTVAWLFSDFFQKISYLLETSKNVVWQSHDSRVTSDQCRVALQRLFFLNFKNCLKRLRNGVWQSVDGRETSDHCHVTVLRLFWKIFIVAWNVEKPLSDSRLTVAWPSTTVAWLFSDFRSIFRHIRWNVEKIRLKASEESFDLPAILFPWFLRTTPAYAS